MLYTSASLGMLGCVDSDNLQNGMWASTCIDYDTYHSSCNSDCLSNTFIRKCSSAAYPYCYTSTFLGEGVKDYGCIDTIIGTSSVATIWAYANTGLYLSTSTFVTLSTLSGDDISLSATDPADGGNNNGGGGGGGGGGGSSRKTKKTVSVGLIAGAVIAGIVVLTAIGALILFCCLKQKKKRQLEQNAATVAAVQANRPQQTQQDQSQQQYGMQQVTQQSQQPLLSQDMGISQQPQQPLQPGPNSYFPPSSDQKYSGQVYEQPIASPAISNPPTPAPAYVQPYYAAPGEGAAPPMPTSPSPYGNKNVPREPTPGTHEVDAVSVPKGGAHVYEIGQK
jgi:hypothetical protein